MNALVDDEENRQLIRQQNSHRQRIREDWKTDESSQDVTLVCDDKTKVKAHQMVLKACSPVFTSMLEGVDHPKPVIFLRSVQPQELESILQFMYLGQATFYAERMNEFLNVARILEVKELSKDIEMDVVKGNEHSEKLEESLLQEGHIEGDIVSSKNTISLLDEDRKNTFCQDCGREFSGR